VHPAGKNRLGKLTSDSSSWIGSSLLLVQQVTHGGLGLPFQVADQMRVLTKTQGGDGRLKHKAMGSVFFEASTRTSASFQAAMQRLGGSVVHVDGHEWANSSVAQKVESLEDAIRTLEQHCDIAVLRHPISGSVEQVSQVATRPIVNAGDGAHEHPTQAFGRLHHLQ